MKDHFHDHLGGKRLILYTSPQLEWFKMILPMFDHICIYHHIYVYIIKIMSACVFYVFSCFLRTLFLHPRSMRREKGDPQCHPRGKSGSDFGAAIRYRASVDPVSSSCKHLFLFGFPVIFLRGHLFLLGFP